MTVRDDKAAGRFELATGEGVAFAAYERIGDRIVFTHTVVPEALRGGGLGSRLIAGALAAARGEALEVVADCPFVAAYLQQHPDAAG